jgi:hypothetical protein
MGMCMGIEVFPGDEIYLTQILLKQISTPFQLAQMTFFRWIKHGFVGKKNLVQMLIPEFSPESRGDS